MIWAAEWTIALRARRLFLFNVAVPLGLVAAIGLGGAPAAHAAMAYTLLIVFFGTFGSAIPLVRDAQSGLLTHLILGGVRESELLAARSGAGAGLDAVQLAPALVVIALAGDSSAAGFGALLFWTTVALVSANFAGVWIAAAARSIAEAALLGSVLALLALHFSGVFRVPAPGTFAARIEPWSPLHALNQAVRSAAGAGVGTGAESIVAGAAGAALLCLLTIAASTRLARALMRAPRS